MLLNRIRLSVLAGALALGAGGMFACSDRNDTTAPTDQPSLARGGTPGPDLRAALAAQAHLTPLILAKEGVVGTGVSVGSDGKGVVRVFLVRAGAASVVKSFEGVAVETQVTGEIKAIDPTAAPSPGTDPTKRFNRPVPIGVSAGNLNDLVYLRTVCTTGTLGARLHGADGHYYALSNNHVFAVENKAQLGDPIIQPGQADNGCRSTSADQIGTLAAIVPLNFSRTGTNTVDAAAGDVGTTSPTVDNQTPSNGYGTPSSSTVAASVGQSVKKYGRTTVLTHGSVSSINATIKVSYGKGNRATFVNQIVFTGNNGGAFSDSGDSGSLIVTETGNNPVALLFAGSTSTTIGSPINNVLTSLGSALNTTLTIQ